jgi:hypothetical protein
MENVDIPVKVYLKNSDTQHYNAHIAVKDFTDYQKIAKKIAYKKDIGETVTFMGTQSVSIINSDDIEGIIFDPTKDQIKELKDREMISKLPSLKQPLFQVGDHVIVKSSGFKATIKRIDTITIAGKFIAFQYQLLMKAFCDDNYIVILCESLLEKDDSNEQ